MRRSSRVGWTGAAILLVSLLWACNGADKRNGETGPEVGPTHGAGDYWLDHFGGYMTPEFRKAFEETDPKERFRVHGEALMEFHLREELLAKVKGKLAPRQEQEYRRLPDLEASREYLKPYHER